MTIETNWRSTPLNMQEAYENKTENFLPPYSHYIFYKKKFRSYYKCALLYFIKNRKIHSSFLYICTYFFIGWKIYDFILTF